MIYKMVNKLLYEEMVDFYDSMVNKLVYDVWVMVY